jgi:hypothetical protein
MMHEPLGTEGPTSYSACSSASSTKPVRIDEGTCQPTMRRANTPVTKATYAKPCQVETRVKSDTHSALGRLAWNSRWTRSSGHGAAASLIVVRTTLPRMTPRTGSRRISRSTEQRATAMSSRASWRQTLRAPRPRKMPFEPPPDSIGDSMSAPGSAALRRRQRPGSGSVTLHPLEPDMRFTKAEGHFTTKEQALAEIASHGWHAIERSFSAEDELHWHDFDAVVYVLEGTASAEYEDGAVEHAGVGCRVAAPAGIVHRNVGPDWHGIIAFSVHPSKLTQPVNKPSASRPSVQR